MELVAIIILAIFLSPAVGFVLLILKLAKKTAQSSWKGEVVDKLYNTKRDDENHKKTHSFYTLVVKTDEGLTRKVAVTREMYDSCKVGDKLEKPKGKLNPVKA